MEHTYTDSRGRRLRYADGGYYCSRPGEEEVYFSMLDDRDREILRLAERVRDLEDEVAAREGTLHMAVARLCGMVEGHPTQRVNFLQRIDALRRIEEKEGALRKALAAIVDAHFASASSTCNEAIEDAAALLREGE